MIIKSHELALPLGLGTVNAHLITTGQGHVLIDTGPSHQRLELTQWLVASGVQSLALTIITHGDFDHTGNAAYLRERFGTPIATHPGDRAMTEQGDMFAGRNKGNRLLSWVSSQIFGFRRAEHFVPDILLTEGQALSRLGLEARVIELPGHSSGSIGILTGNGDLFCGDLLENAKQGPALSSIMDDAAAARTSLVRLQALPIRMVYPGHGKPFEGQALTHL